MRKLDIVFWFSAIVVAMLVVIGAVAPKAFGATATKLFDFTTYAFGWFYLLSVLLFVIFCIGIALTKYGKIRLGRDDDRPEFPFFTWIGMLFSAGFGVGLVFWGIAEPMSHFYTPPSETVDALGESAARLSMQYSFFHWGVSQWSVFTIVGLAIGYFQFRKNEDGLISTTLKPILGEKSTRTYVSLLIFLLLSPR